MNIIPKINGKISLSSGVFSPKAPLTYKGGCPFAEQFKMIAAPDGVIAFETDTSIPAEGYRLTVTPNGITVASWDENGAFYGMQTVSQLMHEGDIPCGVYEDAPKHAWRGFMLDVSRHFFPIEEVKKVVDMCAKLKLNRFHWHLSDDQGYRIESKKFPRLNEISSWRIENGEKVGGWYTQDEIRDLVSYAAERYIDVIPEIDLPGHTTAIVAAFPELSCSGKPAEVQTGAGIFPRILCGGSEKVYEFLDEFLGEVCSLFPANFFHIGGDEAPKGEWEKCEKCQAEMKKHGLENEEELQALFTERLADILAKCGKAVIGWNEILASGKMKDTAIAQYWTDGGASYSALEIPKDRKFIFSNSSSFYFDYDHTIVTLEGTYSYEPYIPGGESVKPEQILGLEAPLWTERVFDCERLEKMIFPRMEALAENCWTQDKDYGDFLRRARLYEAVLDENGVAHFTVEEADDTDPVKAAKALYAQMRAWHYDKEEQFTLDMVRDMKPDFVRYMFSPTTPEDRVQKIYEEIKKKCEM